MHEEQAAAGSLVREHDIGPGGSVVVAVDVDDVRVRGVDGTTVRRRGLGGGRAPGPGRL